MSPGTEQAPTDAIAKASASEALDVSPSSPSSAIAMDATSGVNLHALDALRGGLAIYVLAHHSRWLLWEGMSAWRETAHSSWASALATLGAVFRGGHEAVMIFFALSGFFIHLRTAAALATGAADSLSIPTFFRRRARRLVPPYLLALVLTAGLDLIGMTFWPILYAGKTGDPLIDPVMSRSGYSLLSLLPALWLLPASWGYNFGTNGPLWSLAYEIVYYVLYPAWRSLRLKSLSAAYLLIPFACLLISAMAQNAWLLHVLSHWTVWLAGAFTAELLMKGSRRVPVGLAAVSLTLLSVGILISPFPEPIPLLGRCGLGAGIVAFVANLPQTANRLSILRGFEWLGLRSYTIYIVHMPWLVLASAFLFEHGGRPASGWLALVAVPLVVLVCLPLFEACERRWLHPRLTLSGKPSPHPHLQPSRATASVS